MKGNRILSRVANGLLSFLQEEEEEIGQPSRHTAAPSPTLAPAEEEPASKAGWHVDDGPSELAQRITDAVASSGGATAAGLYTVGLERLKKELGPRWPRLADRMRSLACRVIERHLTPGEFYQQVDEESFLIVMPGLDESRARLKVALISEKLMSLLTGSDSKALVDIRSSVSDIAEATTRPDGVMGWIEQERRHSQSPEMTSGPPPLPSLDDLLFVYRPLWYRKRRHVTTYLCLPAVVLGSQRMLIGDEVLSLWDRNTAAARVDMAALQRAASDARDAVLAGKRCLLAAPVHIDTLNGPKRISYLAECWAIPEIVRKSLVLEIYGITERTGQRVIDEAVATLRPVTRAVMARATPDGRTLSRIRQAGASAAGLDAGGMYLPENEAMRRLDDFAGHCTELGLLSYVHGLRTLSMLTAAVGAQFTYIGGDPVSSLVAAPADSYPLDLLEMYTARLPI